MHEERNRTVDKLKEDVEDALLESDLECRPRCWDYGVLHSAELTEAERCQSGNGPAWKVGADGDVARVQLPPSPQKPG